MKLKTTFIAKSFPEFHHELVKEIEMHHGQVISQYDDLVVYSGLTSRPLWAQFVGESPEVIEFDSINDGAHALLKTQKRWCSQSFKEHRRAELIQEKVFRYKVPHLKFMQPLTPQSWGFWSLIEKNKMLVCQKIDSDFPLGKIQFLETTEPPSRAYLKLWEVFTCHSVRLSPQEPVVDLGACPGGWSWVLAQMGARVTAVDKAPLDEKVSAMSGVHFVKKDAFKLSPQDVGSPVMMFSDIICYPKDLLELVKAWMDQGVQRFVCTLKFKGETDWATIHEFQKIPDSQLVHLCANKHELTFIKKI